MNNVKSAQFQKDNLIKPNQNFKRPLIYQPAWVKGLFILVITFLLGMLLPNHTFDPWGVLNLSKIFKLIFALMFIQLCGMILIKVLGIKKGLVISGFLSGLVSSTALTAALSKQSQESKYLKNPYHVPSQIIPFLSGIIAMLSESLILVVIACEDMFSIRLIGYFVIPLITTATIMALLVRKNSIKPSVELSHGIKFSETLKLVLFILGVLTLSKISEENFGHLGLRFITFIVSLFEVHGSLISNSQLYINQSINLENFTTLILLSNLASCVSKLFITSLLGSKPFKKYAGISLVLIMLSMFLGIFL